MFSKNDIKEICALTPMQRGMLHHALLEPDSRAYHEQLILRLDGNIATARMEQAWQQVINRHDALRGRFLSERVSNPVQLILHHEQLTLAQHQLAAPGQCAGEDGLPAELEAFLACDRAQGFELDKVHPMRLALFSAGTDRHWLVWSFHHILLDGWSIGIVLEQVLALYGSQTDSPATPAPPYAGYLRWLAARDSAAAQGYWQHTLSGFSGEALTTDGSASEPAHASATLDAISTALLRDLARTERASLHHLLLCAWALTAGRQLDQCDVIVPTVLAGRSAELDGADSLVGLLINTVPMRVRWQAGDSFAGVLRQVRDHSREAERHQFLSMAEIQAVTGKLPIDHVLLVQGIPGQDLPGARCGEATIGWTGFRESIPYALEVSLTPHDQGIHISLRGKRDPAWLQALANQLQGLLAAAAQQPQRRLGELDLLSAAQRSTLLAWGDGGPVSAHGTILQAFDAQLARAPNAPALVSAGVTLSYRALDRRANRLAHALLAEGPIAPDTPVALVAHRDGWLVAGMLAILRAGAAYVPVDPDFPAERVRLMLEASACRLVLAAPDLAAGLPTLPGRRIVELAEQLPAWSEQAPACAPAPEHLAYVIFTSGSTGTPKGAMLSHRNAATFFAGLPGVFGFMAGERILAVTTVSFDIAALELLGALTCGMTIVLASAAEARDPTLLTDLIERERVSVLQMTPTRLALLLDAAASAAAPLDGVRTVLVGGEALPPALAKRLLAMRQSRVFNVYGPTETTIWSACWPLVPGPVRLGRALPGERLLVLSRQGQLQAPGAIGEIAIAGAGVARGYLNDAAHTQQRFIRHADVDGMLYLTGDLGRWNSDGSLDYLGRRDQQVKIGGMRIEIGEIEHQLCALAEVQQAVVAAHTCATGERELVAYIVLAPDAASPGGQDTTLAAVRSALAARLPGPMRPSRFMVLAALPQTPNGKIDRRALPDPLPDRLAAPDSLAERAPASSLEGTITRVFSEVLGHATGVDDDFFLFGGHSLKAIQAVGRLNRELGAGYTLRDLYRATTAGALARVPVRRVAPIVRVPDASSHPLSYAQQALWVLQQLDPDYAGYNVPGAYALHGKLDGAAFGAAWQALVARHESLRTVFRMIDGEPRQVILENMPLPIVRQPGADALDQRIAELTRAPFDLANGPLLRIVLFALTPEHHILLLVTHHIISDGWSDALMVTDLALAYRSAMAGGDPQAALPAAPALRYRDFAAWQQTYLASPLSHAHRSYWSGQLRDVPQLDLRAELPRAHQLARLGARVAFSLDETQANAWLHAVAPGQRYATLVAATLALLYLESGQTDLVLGLPVANRDRAQLQDQVGLHLNMLPLRQQLDGGATLAQLRAQSGDAVIEVLEHADYPFARIVDELGLGAAPGRHPVFDAMLIYHQQAVPLPLLDELQVSVHDPRSYTSRFDLDCEVWTDDEGVHGFIEYDSGLFTEERAVRIAARFATVLAACAHNPETTLGELQQAQGPVSLEGASFLARSLAVNDDF